MILLVLNLVDSVGCAAEALFAVIERVLDDMEDGVTCRFLIGELLDEWIAPLNEG